MNQSAPVGDADFILSPVYRRQPSLLCCHSRIRL